MVYLNLSVPQSQSILVQTARAFSCLTLVYKILLRLDQELISRREYFISILLEVTFPSVILKQKYAATYTDHYLIVFT